MNVWFTPGGKLGTHWSNESTKVNMSGPQSQFLGFSCDQDQVRKATQDYQRHTLRRTGDKNRRATLSPTQSLCTHTPLRSLFRCPQLHPTLFFITAALINIRSSLILPRLLHWNVASMRGMTCLSNHILA